jgi:GAF domain-containing protein
MHDFLHGFIISDGKVMGDLEKDDLSIAHALIQLFGNSLESSRHVFELNEKNKQLDQKVFKLFAINQSSKSLLSEVKLDSLYSLATDVFSEITCSSVTSFGVYDSASKAIKVLGYRDVTTYETLYTELKILNRTYQSSRVVLEFEKDIEIIKAIFENWEEFELLKAKYIVLLVKDEILGVVTLSESVNGNPYDEETFELVETLASFAHIAISNALLFKEIVNQKERVEKKFGILDRLNKITRNINRSNSIEEISSLTLKVLALNFGIKKAFFSYRIQDSYVVSHVFGLNNEQIKFCVSAQWEKALQGEMVSDFCEVAIQDYFNETIKDQIGYSNCIVISPIFISQSSYNQQYPLGFLVVFETKDSLKEEEILLIDTITKNISPIIYQMDSKQKIKKQYILDPVEQFVQIVREKLEERKEYSLNFYIYYKRIDKNPLKKADNTLVAGEECYIIDNVLFVITYEYVDCENFTKLPDFKTVEELLEFDFK